MEEKFEQAIACFSEALEKDLRHISSLRTRGFALLKTGDLENVLKDFDLALGMERDKTALAHLGQIFLIQEKPGKALADLSEASAMEPEPPPLIRLHSIVQNTWRNVAHKCISKDVSGRLDTRIRFTRMRFILAQFPSS